MTKLKTFILAIFSLLLLTSTAGHTAPEWQLRKDEKGIKVFTRKIAGSDFRAFRAETELATTLPVLMAVHADVEYVKTWMKDCAESEFVTEFDPNGFFAYFRTASPWPVKDRDYVVKYRIEQDPNDYTLTIHFSAVVGVVPLESDCVRLTELEGFWKMTPIASNRVHVVYQVDADPGGNVPSWLANQFVVDQPFESLRQLKKRVTLERYQGKHFDFIREPVFTEP